MSECIPVNPQILRWARETIGYTIDDVVAKMDRKQITFQTLEAWEDGSESPTYTQLERLAYEIYKRPLALFFFPSPPQEETPKQSFRTLPETEISIMDSRLRYLIRQARVMQINLSELSENENSAPRQILRDLRFEPNVSVQKMTDTVRRYLGITLDSQVSWRNTDDAFKGWRNIFERKGIYVFKDTFNQRIGRESQESPFSGFCLYDEEFPIIYVNNSKSDTRQIFTLFHELCHLLLGTGGVDTRLDDYIHLLKGDDRKTEILCNQFASSFLVPDVDFNQRIAGLSIHEGTIEKLANRYHVSREVILRKYFDRGMIEQSDYERLIAKWAASKRSARRSGGDYYKTKKTYLGEKYIDLVFSRYYQKKITIEQLAGYLGEKVKNIVGMEMQLLGGGGVS